MDYFKYNKFSMEKRREILESQRNVCALCGRRLEVKGSSIDHVIPRAIIKWVSYKLGEDELELLYKVIMESKDNIILTHQYCNERKNTRIKIKDIDKLYGISQKRKKRIKNLYHSIEPHINRYKSMVGNKLKAQHHRCAICHKIISVDNCTVRRIDNSEARRYNNAILVCWYCNKDLGRMRCHGHRKMKVYLP